MYKWQKAQWNNAMQRRDKLPHALLMRGRLGIGKHDFAISLSHALLCQQLNDKQQACGVCASCQWLKEGAHPDFKLIAPEEESPGEGNTKKKGSKKSQITVAQIRQLYDYLSLSTHQVGGLRIILISPAETLNLASANALLKMLEEPPTNTIFILVTSQPQRLLPTIISRCQVLDLPIPSTQDAIEWLKSQGVEKPDIALQYAGGAPLAAVRFAEQLADNDKIIKHLALGSRLDPFISTPLLTALGMERALDVIQKWTFDLLSYRLVQELRYHGQYVNTLQVLCKSVNLSGLLRFQRSLDDAKRTANHPLNNEMQLENILLQYTRVFNL
jgi:DNA polymerase III subunit delta'